MGLAEDFNEGEKEYDEYSTLVNFWTEKAEQVCIKSTAALEKINASIRKVHYTKKECGKIKVESVATKED